MVANNDREQELRANRLWSKIAVFLERGNRDAKNVADVLQVIHDDRNFAQVLLAEKVSPAPKAPGKHTGLRPLLRDQQKFFTKHFPTLKLDLQALRIPEKKEGFDRLIIVPQGLTPNLVYAAMLQQFKCWKYTDNLDDITSDRDPKSGAYAIWLRDRVEADEELKNLSANQLKQMGIKGITLLERLLYELKFWDETHTHLDTQSWTLCFGSRYASGGVPIVYWYPFDGRVYVNWSLPTYASGYLRCRQAVS